MNKFNEVVKKIRLNLSYLQRAIDILNEIEPNLVVLQGINGFLRSILPYITICFFSFIVEALIKEKSIGTIMQYIIIAILSYFILSLVSNYLSSKIKVKERTIEENHEVYLNQVSYGMDFSQLEDAQINKLREQITGIMEAQQGGLLSIPKYIFNISKSLFSIVIAIFISYRAFLADFPNVLVTSQNKYMFELGSICFVSIIVISIINIINNSKVRWNEIFRISMKGANYNRYISYYLEEYLEDNKYAKDIRIYNQSELVTSEMENNGFIAWTKVFKECEGIEIKYGGRNSIILGIVSSSVYVYVGLKALKGIVSIGDVVMYNNAIVQMIQDFANLSETLAALSNNNLYLKQLYSFIDLPSEFDVDKTNTPYLENSNFEVEFRNVYFKYPGSEEYALKNVNLHINSTKKLAVVGENGSGKTTLIKLLCGLYKPTKGNITLNGVDIAEYSHEEYIKLFSIVFQDFMLFSLPIGQNVAAKVEYDEIKVWGSLKKSGIKTRIEQCEEGLDTVIYSQFSDDGVDVSGGEEQKIAIARALYRNAPILIMDEPTASLDPESEYEIYENMGKIAEEKMIIYISHRLSSCCFSDSIIVFDKGELVQLGTHEALLLEHTGKYYYLWNAQAQYYSNK